MRKISGQRAREPQVLVLQVVSVFLCDPPPVRGALTKARTQIMSCRARAMALCTRVQHMLPTLTCPSLFPASTRWLPCLLRSSRHTHPDVKAEEGNHLFALGAFHKRIILVGGGCDRKLTACRDSKCICRAPSHGPTQQIQPAGSLGTDAWAHVQGVEKKGAVLPLFSTANCQHHPGGRQTAVTLPSGLTPSHAHPEPKRLAAASLNCFFISSMDPKLSSIAFARAGDGAPDVAGEVMDSKNMPWL